MQILNLTQHKSTQDQNIQDLNTIDREILLENLNFDEIPSKDLIDFRAKTVANLAVRHFVFQIQNFISVENNVDEAMMLLLSVNHSIKQVLMHFECKVMIGGAPFFTASLEHALKEKGIQPVYAFSKRVSTEIQQKDGSVEKVNVFKHLGFVEV